MAAAAAPSGGAAPSSSGAAGEIVRVDVARRFAEMVVYGGVAYLAGQVPDAEAADGDAATQTASVLAQVDALLARAGSDKTRLLSAQVYLTSMEHYAGMNAAWEAWLPAGHAPARATVGNVTLANPKWVVEIVVTAAAGAPAATTTTTTA